VFFTEQGLSSIFSKRLREVVSLKAALNISELEFTPCALGCVSDDEEILVGHDRLHGLPGDYHVVKCRNCGLLRTNPRPTSESMERYYPEDYGPYQSTAVNLTQRSQPAIRSLSKLLDPRTKIVPQLSPGRMLEIGCGSGAFLHQMANLGWQVEGLEMNAKAAARAHALGYPVRAASLERASDPREPYDLIVGWHVFEHLQNPVLVLQKLHRWSKNNGWLALSMPDAGSWEFKLFRDKWYALQVPTHLYHYTPDSLKKVLACGDWELDRLFWQDNPNNLLHSLRYCCMDRNWQGLARYLLDVVQSRRHRVLRLLLAKTLGTLHASGRMTVWARRI
jgi:SAM-dependent methyltransferase